jgi:oligoendopeptidase F
MAAATKTKVVTESPETARRRAAYQRAVKRLHDSHRPELDALLTEEYEKDGLKYRRRLTPEEKARKQIEQLLIEFPSLANDPPF